MEKARKIFEEAASKVPRGGPPKGAGLIGKGAGVLLGLGLGAYGVYSSLVTGLERLMCPFTLKFVFSASWSFGYYL
jgi:hypothetical protein